jgi:ElaB/YqjD/DUF883 family membrane-anchored ribosome-binding protein
MADRQSTASRTASEKELGEQIDQLRKDVLAITETLKSLGQAKAEDVKGNVKAKAAELTAAGRSKAEDLSRSAADLEADFVGYVREKPVQSLAIAAALGLVLGLISRRG